MKRASKKSDGEKKSKKSSSKGESKKTSDKKTSEKKRRSKKEDEAKEKKKSEKGTDKKKQSAKKKSDKGTKDKVISKKRASEKSKKSSHKEDEKKKRKKVRRRESNSSGETISATSSSKSASSSTSSAKKKPAKSNRSKKGSRFSSRSRSRSSRSSSSDNGKYVTEFTNKGKKRRPMQKSMQPLVLKNLLSCTPSTRQKVNLASHFGQDPGGASYLYCTLRSVVIRNVKSPLKARVYSGHRHPTIVARYSHSGDHIASSDEGGFVQIWNSQTLALVLEVKVFKGPALDLAWSADDKRIATVGHGVGRHGCVFKVKDGGAVFDLKVDIRENPGLLSCDYAGDRIAVSSASGNIFVFNAKKGKLVHTIRPFEGRMHCVRFSPDGGKIMAVGEDNEGLLYDASSGKKVATFGDSDAHTDAIYAACWSPSGKMVLTGGRDETARVWAVKGGKCMRTFTCDGPQVGVLWQGDFLLSLSANGDINYLNMKRKRPQLVVKGHNAPVTSLAWDVSLQLLYSGDESGALQAWKVGEGGLGGFVGEGGHELAVTCLGVQDGYILSTDWSKKVLMTPAATRDYTHADKLRLTSTPIAMAAGKKDKELLLALTMAGVLLLGPDRVLSTQSLESLGVGDTIAAAHAVKGMHLHPDEGLVALAGKGGVMLMAVDEGSVSPAAQPTLSLGPANAPRFGSGPPQVSCVAFSPDGEYLAAADGAHRVAVWTLESAAKKRRTKKKRIGGDDEWVALFRGWVGHTARIMSLSWSPDSKHIATGALDGRLAVWSIDDPTERAGVSIAHTDGVRTVCWVANNVIASGGDDGCVKTWVLP